MRIARVMLQGRFVLRSLRCRRPGRGKALVRIKAVGICGSDLQYYAQGRIGDLHFTAGHILGHEVAGVVEGLGPGVDGPPGHAGGGRSGDPVWALSVLHGGQSEFLFHLRFFGSLHGRALKSSSCTLASPPADCPSMPFPVAAAIEPLGVAIHAVDLGHLKTGCRVAIFGCAPSDPGRPPRRLSGAAVVCASEPLPHRRAAAAQHGATASLIRGIAMFVQGIRRQHRARGWTSHSRWPGARRRRSKP